MKIKRHFLKGFIVCISLLSLFLIPTSSLGATFCVTNATELQAALTTAENNGEDNTIQIVQGTYNGNFTYASTEAYSLTVVGGYTEDCASRTIDPANTILDGGGTDTVLVLVSQSAANFSIEGITLQSGNASTVDSGGGLYVKTGGNVTLTNNTFTGNTASSQGGGLYVYWVYSASDTRGIITLNNNTLTENTAGTGGGAYVSGANTTLTNNTFTGNTGSGAYVSGRDNCTLTTNTFAGNTTIYSGGGVYVSSMATLRNNTFTDNIAGINAGAAFIRQQRFTPGSTLDNNIFIGNTASNSGGGIYVEGYSGFGGSAILTGNTFTDNTATNGNGGGVCGGGPLTNNTFTGNTANNGSGGGTSGGTLTNNTFTDNTAKYGGGTSSGDTLTNNTFTGNTATENGGGSSSGGTLTNNTFTDNTAKYGGGTSGGNTLINNIFTGNTATENGGGVYIDTYKDTTLTNNTLSDNVAETQGGGFWLTLNKYDFTGSIYNNIIWNNTASDGADLYIDNTGDNPFFPVTVNLFNNDFDQSTSGTYIAEPFTIDTTNLNNTDPLFVGSGDYHLTASSPCINTGDNNAPDLPDTDKDGNPRIMGGTVDMGAYEYQIVAYVNKNDNTCDDKTPCYTTIQEAIDVSSDGTLIRVVAGNYEEDISQNASKTLTLKGGYDSAFTAQLSDTTIKGSLIISDGKLKTSKINVHYQKY